MTALPPDTGYEQRLRCDVADSLDAILNHRQDAVTPLADLFGTLPGYWPPDVLQALDHLARDSSRNARSAAAASAAGAMRADVDDDTDRGDPVRRLLPVPHPLDADWRFAIPARERLLARADEAAPGACVLLGTPTIFAHACGQLDLREVVLVDRSVATVRAATMLADGHTLLRAVHADLGFQTGGLVPGQAGVVVADPPWYRPEQVAFLRAAAGALKPDGTLLMAASPAGSRPSALTDRELLLGDAEACAFELEEIVPSALPYTSPPFERAAMAWAGASGTPTSWRSADLLVLRRRGSGSPPYAPAIPRSQTWHEATVDRVRVRVQGHADDQALPSIRPAVPGGISADVSRRSADRGLANVWTTGNGAWVASGAGAPDLLLTAVRDGEARQLDGGEALLAALALEIQAIRRWGWA